MADTKTLNVKLEPQSQLSTPKKSKKHINLYPDEIYDFMKNFLSIKVIDYYMEKPSCYMIQKLDNSIDFSNFLSEDFLKLSIVNLKR